MCFKLRLKPLVVFDFENGKTAAKKNQDEHTETGVNCNRVLIPQVAYLKKKKGFKKEFNVDIHNKHKLK